MEGITLAEVSSAGLGQKTKVLSRRAVLVSPHPFRVWTKDLDQGSFLSEIEVLSANLIALEQVRNSNGKSHFVVREDSPFFDYQPARLAEEQIGPWDNKTVLSPQQFDEFARLFVASLTNEDKLREFILVAEELVPAMQIAPKRVHDLLGRPGYERLPRYFARHDLLEFAALVWIGGGNDQLSKAELERVRMTDMDYMHLGGGWYAFRTMEDAIAVKLTTNKTEVHPIRD